MTVFNFVSRTLMHLITILGFVYLATYIVLAYTDPAGLIEFVDHTRDAWHAIVASFNNRN